MKLALMHPRDIIASIMKRLYGYGMTTTSGGNLSIMDSDGNIWISPGGVDKGTLTAQDIIKVKPDGSTEGIHNPSSEFPFHRSIYELRPDVKAILHAHPSALVAFSIASRVPNIDLLPMAHEICGDIGFAPYEVPGSQKLGDAVSKVFAEGANCILLENHGTVTAGANLLEAFIRFETLDYLARIQIKAEALGIPRPLEESTIRKSCVRNPELPEFIPAGHSPRECELRSEMVKFINRSYSQMLAYSTGGTFSTRVSGNSFLITPTGFDRLNVLPGDLVLVQDGYREMGKRNSRAAGFCRDIYAKHDWIEALIIAKPPNIMAFGVTGIAPDTRTIPESYIMLRDIPAISCVEHYDNPGAVSELLSPSSPVVLVQNDCLIVAASSMLQAFDRLEVAEFTATSLLSATRLGGLHPITEEQVSELIEAFKLPV
ncbi:MAG: class II aldolase/adducin family protein [Victivallales bacterium]|nr:class II aldolase/adducin family protein [Victivallales bacterium]